VIRRCRPILRVAIPHIAFSPSAPALAPPDATKATHASVRDVVKPISLGVKLRNVKIRCSSGPPQKSLLWAADKLARHRNAYSVFPPNGSNDTR